MSLVYFDARLERRTQSLGSAAKEPESYTEADRDPRWIEATDEELQAIGPHPFNTTSLRHKLEGEELKLSRKG